MRRKLIKILINEVVNSSSLLGKFLCCHSAERVVFEITMLNALFCFDKSSQRVVSIFGYQSTDRNRPVAVRIRAVAVRIRLDDFRQSVLRIISSPPFPPPGIDNPNRISRQCRSRIGAGRFVIKGLRRASVRRDDLFTFVLECHKRFQSTSGQLWSGTNCFASRPDRDCCMLFRQYL